MSSVQVRKIAQWTGFGIVLVTSLSISWWSMFTMAMDEFGMPAILAGAVSLAFDGAALFVALLASEYSKTFDSGFVPRLTTMIFVALSAYLNWAHAELLSLPLVGQIFLATPSIVSGILFELYLRFIHRTEMRANGLVPKRMPVFGKLSWMMFPGKTLKGFRSVIFFRLNETVTKATGQGLSPKKSVTKSVTKTVPTEDIQGTKPSDTVVTKKVTSVPEDKKVTVKSDTVTSDINKDMSVSLLVKKLWAQGVTDRVTIRKTIEDLKGTTVPTNTINKAVSRLDTVPGK